MTASDDPYDLCPLRRAQGVYVRAELAAGRKSSHWMWFVFPQLEGLGASADGAALRHLIARRGAAYLGASRSWARG